MPTPAYLSLEGTKQGLITAGTFHRDGKRTFWNVRHPDRAVVIELQGEAYQRLVIEVQDPRAAVELIEAALARG